MTENFQRYLESYRCVKSVIGMLKNLSEKERNILFYRNGFSDGMTHTLEECGKQFSVTRERIRQIEAKAVEKIAFEHNKEMSTTERQELLPVVENVYKKPVNSLPLSSRTLTALSAYYIRT